MTHSLTPVFFHKLVLKAQKIFDRFIYHIFNLFNYCFFSPPCLYLQYDAPVQTLSLGLIEIFSSETIQIIINKNVIIFYHSRNIYDDTQTQSMMQSPPHRLSHGWVLHQWSWYRTPSLTFDQLHLFIHYRPLHFNCIFFCIYTVLWCSTLKHHYTTGTWSFINSAPFIFAAASFSTLWIYCS